MYFHGASYSCRILPGMFRSNVVGGNPTAFKPGTNPNFELLLTIPHQCDIMRIRVSRAPQRDVSNWRGQPGPMPVGAARCLKKIPRSRNAKGTRRNMDGF